MDRNAQNFRLVLLDALARTDADALIAFVEAGVDLAALRSQASDDGDEEGAVAAVIARLAEYPLDDAYLGERRQLTLDGWLDVYELVEGLLEVESGGELGWFATTGTAELQRCRGVETITANVRGRVDCAWLRGLPALRELTLGASFANPEALLELPALTTLSYDARGKLPAEVAHALLARGVTLNVVELGTRHPATDAASWDALVRKLAPRGIPG